MLRRLMTVFAACSLRRAGDVRADVPPESSACRLASFPGREALVIRTDGGVQSCR